MSALLPVLNVIRKKPPVRDELAATKLAIVVQWSGNVKIGRVSTTYQSTVHCVDCPMKGNGCYAEGGMVAMQKRRLDDAVRETHASPLRSARQEAAGIDALRAVGQGLRLHTSGDCPSPETTRVVASAAQRFMARGGGQAWTYTHAWRRVQRRTWRNVSVLASCETTDDARKAFAKGYAPAMVVERFDSPKTFERDGVKLIPCPAQTRDNVTCDSCRLCWNADALHARGMGIAFEAHGASKKRAARAVARCSE